MYDRLMRLPLGLATPGTWVLSELVSPRTLIAISRPRVSKGRRAIRSTVPDRPCPIKVALGVL